MTILYEYNDNLYINLTNKCPCSCVFCLRQTREEMNQSGSLWLEREPSYDEVIAEFNKFDMNKYKEVIFCGFGEPTERIDMVVSVGKYIKDTFNKPIRLNTNGQGSMVNGKDITPMLEGIVDTVSVRLNTPNAEEYNKLVRSIFGHKAYEGIIDFTRNAKKYVPNVIMTTVETTISKEEEEQCQKICDELGVSYRIRPFED